MRRLTLCLLPLAALLLAGCPSKPKTVKKPAAASPAAKSKAQAFYIEGVYAYAEGDTAKAMAAWKKALALDPRHAPTKKAMAEAKAKIEAVKKLED